MTEKLLLLFDFDGVLADSADRTIAISDSVARAFGSTIPMTRELMSTLMDMSIPGGGRAMGVPDDRLAGFEAALINAYENATWDYGIFPGLGDVIKALGKDHILGVVTNNSEILVRRFIELHGLNGCFQKISGQETGGRKSARIIKAARECSVSLERTFMVGDSASDILEAKLAGCRSIAVGWGFQRLEFIEKTAPDYMASTPAQLVAIVSCLTPSLASPTP